jgi:mono/diheme cytochrome c family protein
MSEQGKPPAPWIEQAQTLATRYAFGVGVAVTFLMFGLIVVPALLRERKPPGRAPSDQPAPASMGWLDQAEAPARKGYDLPPVDPDTVLTPNPKLLARGETLFKQHCTSCHGDTGRGDGPAAGTMNPRPRNFTQPNSWTHGYRMTDIYATISAGSKGTGMAAFDFLMPADRMALVHYVRSLGSFDHGPEDPKAVSQLADQFRSKGFHIPNRIPVSLAIQKMAKEQANVAPLPFPDGDDRSPRAELLRSAIGDPVRAARTVAATDKRDDQRAVARAWAAGAPENGFAAAVASLNAEEWSSLVQALLGGNPPPSPGKEEQQP